MRSNKKNRKKNHKIDRGKKMKVLHKKGYFMGDNFFNYINKLNNK